QAEDGIRDDLVTGVQTCALPILTMSQSLFGTGPNPVLDALNTNATYRTFTQAALVLGGLATVVLIASGIGLLQMRPYGRVLAIRSEERRVGKECGAGGARM